MRVVTEVISTKRSAHHAFVDWLCRNTDRPTLFFNNVIASDPPKLRETFSFNVPEGSASEPRHRLGALLESSSDVVMNFEGKLPANIVRWNEDFLRPRLKGRLRRIVFLRDPVNTLASLARRVRADDYRSRFSYFQQVVALEETIEQLGREMARLCDRAVVMSAWQGDPGYRAELAEYFELKSAALPGEVTRFGGGSSFAGLDFDPREQSDALLERWREVESNPLFLAPFADARAQEMLRLYFSLFGSVEKADAAVVERLVRRAATERRAAFFARDVLQPLRRARAQIVEMEAAANSAAREAWKAVIRTRMALRV